MKTAIVIVSTRPGSGRGGIATASESLLAMLGDALPVCCIITHDPRSGRFSNSVRFGVSCIIFVFRLLSFWIRGIRPVTYLQVGPRGSLIRKLFFAVLGRIFFSPVVVHHHSSDFSRYFVSGGVMRWCLLRLSALATRNFVLSEWWRDLYVSQGVQNVQVVPNVVMQKVTNVGEGKRYGLICVSRLTSGKGVGQAIQALAFLPARFELSVAGDGPERDALAACASELGVASRVDFLGWIDGEPKAMLYRGARVFVLPSEYDSFGLVYLEALSAGCMVVAGPNPMVMSALSGLDGVFFSADYSPESIAKTILEAEAATPAPELVAASVWRKYGASTVGRDLLNCLNSLT